MRHFADLHFHSKYSRAVSPNMELNGMNAGALRKGLTILGTGDFTHPLWFKELKERLTPDESAPGFYRLSKDSVRFMLTCEVSTLCSTPNGAKKVHHILHASDLEQVAQLNDVLSKKGNLAADGRPMFGKTMPAEIVELVRSVSKTIVVVPAHIWTPWFSAFGSKSGFDSMDAAYSDQSRHIFAFETGISSDPAMNWRISSLDRLTPMSNSDSHSNYPWRLGRECNAFEFVDGDLSFDALWNAVQQKNQRHFLYTIETPPAYGKYHWDGHRACHFSCSPAKTRSLGGICPKCQKPLTIGVDYRVEQLADRPEGFIPKKAIPFKTLLPLHELASVLLNKALSTKSVSILCDPLISMAGSELAVLLDLSEKKIAGVAGAAMAKAVMANRFGKISVQPGFDGEYGKVQWNQE